MCLWAIYIFPGSVHIFSYSRIGRSIEGIMYRSQTHECGNLDCGRKILFWKYVFRTFGVWFFFCSALYEHTYTTMFSVFCVCKIPWEDRKIQLLVYQIYKQNSDWKLADDILKLQNIEADYIILKVSSFLLNNMNYYIPKQIPSPSVPEVED